MSTLPTRQDFITDVLSLVSPPTDEADCSICRSEWNSQDQEVVGTPCNHIFHRKCLTSWFSDDDSNSTCPTCRQRLFVDTSAIDYSEHDLVFIISDILTLIDELERRLPLRVNTSPDCWSQIVDHCERLRIQFQEECEQTLTDHTARFLIVQVLILAYTGKEFSGSAEVVDTFSAQRVDLYRQACLHAGSDLERIIIGRACTRPYNIPYREHFHRTDQLTDITVCATYQGESSTYVVPPPEPMETHNPSSTRVYMVSEHGPLIPGKENLEFRMIDGTIKLLETDVGAVSAITFDRTQGDSFGVMYPGGSATITLNFD
jgi:hypothetical protein